MLVRLLLPAHSAHPLTYARIPHCRVHVGHYATGGETPQNILQKPQVGWCRDGSGVGRLGQVHILQHTSRSSAGADCGTMLIPQVLVS